MTVIQFTSEHAARARLARLLRSGGCGYVLTMRADFHELRYWR